MANMLQKNWKAFPMKWLCFAEELLTIRIIINEVIFEAQMGTLNRTSRAVTGPHYPQ
jgi:hypothetical protein